MVLEKAQIKAEPLIQIGGIKREKNESQWLWLSKSTGGDLKGRWIHPSGLSCA